jgi:predicted dehydrogenase
VGGGWRAEFFARLAGLLPERLTLVGAAVRRPDAAAEATRRWSVAAYLSPAELVAAQRPDFVVTSLPWAVNPEVVASLVEAGVRVLSETPPAPDADGLRSLWARVGGRGLVQVLYRNPFLGLRLMDEEIAIASILTATAAWARDEGPAPYPLAEACQDHLVGLAIEESAVTGAAVETDTEPWGG